MYHVGRTSKGLGESPCKLADDVRKMQRDDDPLEARRTPIPGPASQQFAKLLAASENRGVTYLDEEYPVFWESASGATVTDADGNRYLDLTAAFGVAAVGHGNPQVVAAVRRQAETLLHGMGDVHPTGVRARLLERLADLTPGDLGHGYLGANGADAIEFARKTAFLATGRPETIAFHGAYHGLSYGALELCGIERFRAPFAAQLATTTLLPYPGWQASGEAVLDAVEQSLLASRRIGAICIEPIAGRAGTRIPPPGFLAGLRRIADAHRVLLIFDEIYTGFGRTGAWFVASAEGVVPDLLCLGKALGGGLPLSAVLGRPEAMAAWPRSQGEALHTATFLGNPLACAAALATLDELERAALPARAAQLGVWLADRLDALARDLSERLQRPCTVRGRGMMWALDLGDARLARRSVYAALQRGLIVLQQGVDGDCIALTPPLTISERQLERALTLLEEAILS